ncbi:AraC family transcriptional regulator [Phreatobacter stygius]|uniref:AraC family transcriptional regulator n=1 Tax=Phreatobacter stygius TaxID=1940610 RepID=A0A4D7B9N9_9HYPH|nr:AraC family transcriptional regulator [Phreatobacter stygius]QCI67280.1 AraC family transcriptional regulator [Phreatobacter stygius]
MQANVPVHAPLARFAAVDTRSPDQARDEIGRIFCPHFLIPTAANPSHFHARHHSAAQAGYSMNFVAYGAEVEIDPGELSGFFLLQVPVRGAARVRCGSVLTEAAAGRSASILSPTLPTRMTWHDGCEKIIVLIRRQEVERLAGAMIDRRCERVEFDTGVDLTDPVGQALARHVRIMLDAADGPAPVPEAYQVLLRDGLATLMLTCLRHDRADLLARPEPLPGPAVLRRAEAYLAAHADRPIAMADVARAAGANLRSLQEAFRHHRQETLSERLQTIRLERLRAALTDGTNEASVTEMMFRAGLGHAGRAAAAYAARYGEAPSETRRRVR